jgi:acyl-CoA hydrolase
MKSKSPAESITTMTELVLPNDTNTLENLRGGKVLHWMDIAAAITAQKHAENIVVTVSVDNVSFHHPIKLGDVVTITAKITRAFNTSMEIHVEVWAENIPQKTRYKSNDAYYSFVALDYRGNTTQVPGVDPGSADEKQLFSDALRRRDLRLILSGKMKPDPDKSLADFFA